MYYHLPVYVTLVNKAAKNISMVLYEGIYYIQ